MRTIKKNLKDGEIVLRIDNPDDFWYLSQIIDPGDRISGKTFRKMTFGGDKSSENVKVVRKPIFLEIKSEKIDLSDHSLRATGKIINGPDDIPLGSYHSFSLEDGDQFRIKKSQWLGFQLEKVKEASEGVRSKVLLVLFDREEAHFALMKSYGFEVLASLKGSVAKKRAGVVSKGDFYAEILAAIKDYDARYSLDHIVVASPAFWKDELLKRIKDNALKKKIISSSCHSVGKKSFDELLKSTELKGALREDRVSQEVQFVESLLSEISKDGLASYGFKEVVLAGESGAIASLLVSDAFLSAKREEGSFHKLDKLMKLVERQQGKVVMISHKHEGGKKLDGLGGIGAILRFKV